MQSHREAGLNMVTVNLKAAIAQRSGKVAIDLSNIGGLSSIIKSLFANNEQGFAYDPNDLTTMFQDAAGTVPVTGAGQAVGLIKDKSGRGNHAGQTNSTSRPILRQNATTGAYYLAFDGTDDFLQTNNIDFTSTDKVSVFAGVRKLSDATRGIILGYGAVAPSPGLLGVFDVAAPSFELKGYSATIPGETSNFDALDKVSAAPNSAVLTVKMWQSAPTRDQALTLKVNSIKVLTYGGESTLPGNLGNLPMFIGRRAGTTLPFNGHIYNLIGVGRLTTDSETAALEKLIAKNTGVALSV